LPWGYPSSPDVESPRDPPALASRGSTGNPRRAGSRYGNRRRFASIRRAETAEARMAKTTCLGERRPGLAEPDEASVKLCQVVPSGAGIAPLRRCLGAAQDL